MEKAVLLQILDSSWMEHLRAMDHLRSSIGLQGYAQIDPKVEYKREGMRIFGEMWNGIARPRHRPDLPRRAVRPRVSQLPGLSVEARSGPDDPPSGRIAAQRPSRPPEAFASSKTRRSPASQRSPRRSANRVRNVAKKVGRNDPCPCGSGKKFKACCMRKQSAVDPF